MLKTYLDTLQPKQFAEYTAQKIDIGKYEDGWQAFKSIAYRSDVGNFWATTIFNRTTANQFYMDIINKYLYVQR